MSYPTVDDLAVHLRYNGELSDTLQGTYQAYIDAAISYVEKYGNQEYDLTEVQTRTFEVFPDGHFIGTDNIGSTDIAVTIGGTSVDVTAYPLNSVAKGQPYRWLELAAPTTFSFSTVFTHRPTIASVTAQFGWPTMDAGVSEAVLLYSAKLSQTPEYLAGMKAWAGADGTGGIMRMSGRDPLIDKLIPVRAAHVY